MNQIDDNTPVAIMTAGQLREYLGIQPLPIKPKESVANPQRHYVFGINGIRKLFGVSAVTAIKYKNTVIKKAVMQQGRTIVTDSDMALELFKEWKG